MGRERSRRFGLGRCHCCGPGDRLGAEYYHGWDAGVRIPSSASARRSESADSRGRWRAKAVDRKRSGIAGGLVGEGDGQHRRWRHVPGRDDMRDAMRDDARLAAARSGKNQQGSVDMVYGFTLLRIKPFEEIHERETPYFTMRRRKALLRGSPESAESTEIIRLRRAAHAGWKADDRRQRRANLRRMSPRMGSWQPKRLRYGAATKT